MAKTKIDPKTCPHLKTKRGKNAPRVWGSYRTEVCVRCGSFRYRTHLDQLVPVTDARGGWKPEEDYIIATSEAIDD